MIAFSVLSEATDSAYKDISAILTQFHSDPELSATKLENLQAIVSDPHIHLIVARDGEKIVGMAILFVMVHPDDISGYVDYVVVDDAYRGQGIGSQIMQKLMSVAREHHVEELNLTSRPSREAANHLYQKLGFEKRDTNVYRLKL